MFFRAVTTELVVFDMPSLKYVHSMSRTYRAVVHGMSKNALMDLIWLPIHRLLSPLTFPFLFSLRRKLSTLHFEFRDNPPSVTESFLARRVTPRHQVNIVGIAY